jgi:DNA-binding PadR family transcriptional regulator
MKLLKVDNRLRKYYKLTESGTKRRLINLKNLAEYIKKTMQALVVKIKQVKTYFVVDIL